MTATSTTTVVGYLRTPGQNGTSGWRLGVLALGMVSLGLALIWRLAMLQVVEPEVYVEHGESQRMRSSPLPAERGGIFDRNEVELAVSTPRPSVYADPRLFVNEQDIERAAASIASITGGDADRLARRLSNRDAKFAWMARQLDEETAAAVISLEIPGIYILEEQARITPSGGVARGILGRINVEGEAISGLEAQYDKTLTGVDGREIIERGLVSNDGESVTIPDGRYELIPSSPGNSLVLTIDRTVQFEVEQILLDGVADAGAEHGTAIVSLPSTGEIVAMATVSRASDGSVVVSTDNRAVTAMFEPGSISKPLVVAAMLEDGLVSEETTVEVTDAIEIYDQVITDEIRHEQKVLAIGDVLKYSSNVGMAMLSERIDKDRMHERLASYGIGEPTALGFNAEQAGQLHDVDDWSGVSLASHAIGYNYAATPLQMLRAYNVLANGGVLVEPHIVSRIESREDDRVERVQPESRRVLSEETSQRISRLLAGVVADGTGHLASVPGYEIAGKTGTARLAQPNGSYLDEYGDVHLLTSFAGYLPASHPELSIIVMIEDPAGDASGGRLAAPLFGQISNFALQHFRIPPAASIDASTAQVREQ